MITAVHTSIFIVGTGRCGTSILAEAICKNESILNMGETHLFHDYDKLLQIVRRRFIKGIVKHGKFPEISINQIVDATYQPLGKSVSNILNLLAMQIQKDTILDKTPYNLENMRLFSKVYPNPYFIHVIRNPLDVFSSVRDRTWGCNNVNEFCRWYPEFMLKALAQWRQLEHKLAVHFEKFVNYPGVTLKQVGNFLKLDIPQVQADYPNPDKAHIGRYLEQLTKKEIRLIEKNCAGIHQTWLKECY